VARTTLTDDDRRAFARAMRRVAPLDDAELAAGLALMRPRELGRGEHFLRAGVQATEIGVVVSGFLREHFLLAKGVERTKAFVGPGEATGSLADLLSGGPSRAWIVADAETRVLVGRYDAFRALGERSPAWAALGRRSLELLLLRKAEREYELLGLDAAARYAAFVARWPDLEARVAAKHVASYLGITPVHLSRLRRRRRASAKKTAG